MSKKHVLFIVLLTIVAMLVWILGEILIVAVFNLGGKASVGWTVIMLVLTLILSSWRCCRNEDNKNSRKW